MPELWSPYLTAFVAAWVVGQGAKYLMLAIKHRSFSNFRQLYSSGRMPSAHSTAVVAVVTVIGLKDGIDSALFGLGAVLAGVVMYDAMMVRRSSGEQGAAIQALIREQGSQVNLPRAAKGHTPVEVAVGAILGAAIGIVVFLATK